MQGLYYALKDCIAIGMATEIDKGGFIGGTCPSQTFNENVTQRRQRLQFLGGVSYLDREILVSGVALVFGCHTNIFVVGDVVDHVSPQRSAWVWRIDCGLEGKIENLKCFDVNIEA